MAGSLILKQRQDRIVTLTLNNPDRRNALSMDLVDELISAVDELKADNEIRAVILTGSGKVFSSGGDITSMMPQSGEGISDEALIKHIKDYYLKNLSVMDIPVPTIAAINGHAIGAGCTIALACDMRIASKNAKLGLGFVKIGLHPGMGTTYFLPRLIGTARAYELLLTGELITGEEAAQIGLVNRAVEPDQVMESALELAGKISRGPDLPIRKMKLSIGKSLTRNLEETLDLESQIQFECSKTDDLIEGITAFIERRDPFFK